MQGKLLLSHPSNSNNSDQFRPNKCVDTSKMAEVKGRTFWVWIDQNLTSNWAMEQFEGGSIIILGYIPPLEANELSWLWMDIKSGVQLELDKTESNIE